MNQPRIFSVVVALALALAVAGCGQGQRTAVSAPAAPGTTGASLRAPATTAASSPPLSAATSPITTATPTTSPTVVARHRASPATTTTRPSPATTVGPRPSGPAPAAPGTYYYRQVGSLPGTPAQGSLLVAPASAPGTQVWTRSVGGTVAPATSVMLFNATGPYLLSPGDQVSGGGASCTFASPVPWPPWPTTVGQSYSAHATCTGGIGSYQVSGHVEGTAAESLAGQSVDTAVVVNTIAIKGDVDGDSFNVTMTETDYYAPSLRVPVLTRTQVTGTAIGLPITTTRTDTLVSPTPS